MRKDQRMPYLDWSSTSGVTLSFDLPVRSRAKLSLNLNLQEIQSLSSELEGLYSRNEKELRVTLPQNWVLFWKSREEGSRTLLAHPQPQDWVGTIALVRDDGLKLISVLRDLSPGQAVHLSDHFSMAQVSNLDLILIRAN